MDGCCGQPLSSISLCCRRGVICCLPVVKEEVDIGFRRTWLGDCLGSSKRNRLEEGLWWKSLKEGKW